MNEHTPQAPVETASADTAGQQTPVMIKKYANRRLYNTATSRYVTLETLCQMVKDGVEFVVQDAKTNQDITRSVLTQIIVEEEGKGENLLPTSFLRTLIAMYGNNMQWLVPQYLDYSMKGLAQNQDAMRQQFAKAFGGIFPFGGMGQAPMAMMEQAMRMFNPFAAMAARAGSTMPEPEGSASFSAAAGSAAGPGVERDLAKLEEIDRQLQELRDLFMKMQKTD